MQSLLEKILEVLSENNKNEGDILWLGGKDFRISWANFEELADDIDWEKEENEICDDLKIVGEDWYIEKDYNEGPKWEMKFIPLMPDYEIEIKNLKKNSKCHHRHLRGANFGF